MHTTPPTALTDLRVKIFGDGADEESMRSLSALPYIKGFTTNPSLMREAGVTDYAAFAKEVLGFIGDRSISFEVFSDEFDEMERQARLIHSWGTNVYVKIPSSNTRGESTVPLIEKLSSDGISVNATMIITPEQVSRTVAALSPNASAIVSVFAGRAADSGYDAVALMRECKALTAPHAHIELLWASVRELYNLYEAEAVGAEIITVPPAILKKAAGIGSNLDELTLSGVKKFYADGQAAGYSL